MAEDASNVVPLAKPQPKANPQIGTEFGVTSPLPIGTWESFLGVTGEIPRTGLVSIENLVEMRRKDGQARALYRLLTIPILAALQDAEWVEPEEGDATEETEFANLMFSTPPANGGMTTPLTKILQYTLLALTDGYSVFEEVRQVPSDGPLAGKITLRKLAYRDSRTIQFRVDDRGGFNGVRQVASVKGNAINVVIPKEKVWYYACNEAENPYYGVPAFEAAWQHYDIKRKLYYIAHLAAQFAAVPGRVGETPPSPDARLLAQFKQGLENFAFNTAMTHPTGWKVQFQNNTPSFDFLKLIDHQNHMMSRSVLAGFIDSEDRPALVDIANADPQADLFLMALEATMHEIAESWTYYLMPKYIDWNFGSQRYPEFKFGKLADSTRDAIKEAFIAVVSSSVLNCTPEFVRELEKKLATRLGLDIDYDEIEAMEKKAQEEEQQRQQEEADQQAQMQADALQQQAQVGIQPPAGPPGLPPGGSPKVVAASGKSDIDELVEQAQQLLIRHAEEDLET